MRTFLTAVLSVIATGVVLIAYSALNPRTPGDRVLIYDAQTGTYQLAMPAATGRFVDTGNSATLPQYGYPIAPNGVGLSGAYARPVSYPAPNANTVANPVAQAARPAPRAVRSRASTRNWKKTALVVGGTTASGAGVGALIGGGKGALIGAAIGGGASALYEALH